MARAAQTGFAAPHLISANPVQADSVEYDDAMITEVEAAARSQRIPALAVLDEMTPHLRPDIVPVRAIR